MRNNRFLFLLMITPLVCGAWLKLSSFSTGPEQHGPAMERISNSPIPVGTYSFLKGKFLNQSVWYDIEKDTAEYILLSFWHMNCYPCMKSIPGIHQLMSDFESRNIAFYGINYVDDEFKNAARLEWYTGNNPMNYPTIMVAAEVKDQIDIKGYPTIIVLNQNRNIILHETGYTEDEYSKLSRFIKGLYRQ